MEQMQAANPSLGYVVLLFPMVTDRGKNREAPLRRTRTCGKLRAGNPGGGRWLILEEDLKAFIRRDSETRERAAADRIDAEPA